MKAALIGIPAEPAIWKKRYQPWIESAAVAIRSNECLPGTNLPARPFGLALNPTDAEKGSFAHERMLTSSSGSAATGSVQK